MPKKKTKTSSPNSPRNYSEIANRYCSDVVTGKILANKYVILACQRHLDDCRKSATEESYPYVFDEKKAARICRFIEQLPHVKGTWETETIRLEPWQCFVLCSVFGWVRRDSGLRRFRVAYLKVPRKNGKSLLLAGIGLYMLCADGEQGAVVYAGATSQDQAKEVCFEPASLMATKCTSLQRSFGVTVNAHNIVVLKTASKFVTLIGKPGDGGNPSCALIDEYHEHDSNHLVDCMDTGMGARRQPLLFEVTTAGYTIGGPCHQQEREVEQMLEGVIHRDELFGVCYGLDENDDWTSREALVKANPNFGVSVLEEYLVQKQAAAVQSTHKQNVFRTKHLNQWVGAATAWMNAQLWVALGDKTLSPEDFSGDLCIASLDLSSKLDIAARVKLFKRRVKGADHYYLFPTFYIPEDTLNDPSKRAYRDWVSAGHLIATTGNVIDYDQIEEDLIDDCKRFRIRQLAYDPWNAEQLTQHVSDKCKVERVEVPQQVKHLSEPMKELEALVIAGRFHHDGNPCMNWQMSNVVAKTDRKDNIYPNKERAENKIDGPVAAIMALSRAILSPGKSSVYSTRGVLTL